MIDTLFDFPIVPKMSSGTWIAYDTESGAESMIVIQGIDSGANGLAIFDVYRHGEGPRFQTSFKGIPSQKLAELALRRFLEQEKEK